MTVYRCEDSLESIFTAIYLAYEEKRRLDDTCLVLDGEPLLFAEDVSVRPDPEKYLKVVNTLRRRFGEEDYYSVCLALAAENEEKAQAVFRTIVRGIADKCRQGHLFDPMWDEDVARAFALAREVGREVNHMKEFLRFQELENGILHAVIGSKNNTLTFIMPHFADRLSNENFAIYDDRRNFIGVHPAGKQWFLVHGEEAEKIVLHPTSEELEYRRLFRQFFQTVAIRERRNPDLQRNHLPLRYQKYMVEFEKKEGKM